MIKTLNFTMRDRSPPPPEVVAELQALVNAPDVEAFPGPHSVTVTGTVNGSKTTITVWQPNILIVKD